MGIGTKYCVAFWEREWEWEITFSIFGNENRNEKLVFPGMFGKKSNWNAPLKNKRGE